MQKLHLQLNKLFSQKASLIELFAVAYLFFLPFFAGKILTDSLSWYQGMYVNYFQFRITLHFLIALVLLVLFLKEHWGKFSKAQISMLFILPLGLLATNFITSLAHFQLEFSLVSTFRLAEFIITGLALIISIAIVTTHSSNKVLAVILFSVLIQLLLSAVQVYTGKPFLPDFLYMLGQPKVFDSYTFVGVHILSRAYGTTPHPNILAGIMVLFGLLFAAARIKSMYKILLLIAPLTVIWLTLSRSAMIAIVLGLFLFICTKYLLEHKENMTKLLQNNYILAAAGTFTLISGTILSFLLNRVESLPYFFKTRLILLNSYWGIITQKGLPEIIFGSGFLSSIPLLTKASGSLSTKLIFDNTFLIEPPHNSLILLMNEVGIFGAIIIAFGCFYAFHKVFLLVKKENHNGQKKETPRLIALKVSLIFCASIILLLDHYLIY